MRKNQQGVSYIAILFAIMGFAFMAKVAIAVWAPYFDDRMINSQIEEVFQSSPKNIQPAEFEEQLSKRLEMNSIRDVKIKEIMQVTNTEGLQVKKEYEVRKPFLLNIDLVLKFEKSFDQSSVQAK